MVGSPACRRREETSSGSRLGSVFFETERWLDGSDRNGSVPGGHTYCSLFLRNPVSRIGKVYRRSAPVSS